MLRLAAVLGLGAVLAVSAVAQTVFDNFNTPGWSSGTVQNSQGTTAIGESASGGLGNTPAMGLGDAAGTDATFTDQTAFNFAATTAGATWKLSLYFHVDNGSPSSNAKLQAGFITANNSQLVGANGGAAFLSMRITNSAGASGYSLQSQYKTASSLTPVSSASSAPFTLNTGHWYQFVVNVTNNGGGAFQLGGAVYDWGADGQTGGAQVIANSQTISGLTDVSGSTAVYSCVRFANITGAGDADNFSAWAGNAAPAAPVAATPASDSGSSVQAGTLVTLTETPSSTGNLTDFYQWLRDNGAGGAFTNISGATATNLPVNTTGQSNTGYSYKCTVTNTIGSSTSSAFKLTVTTPLPPPAAPTGLTATPGRLQIALGWNASAGAASYNVKRSTNSGAGYTNISATGTVTGTNYTDMNVAAGSWYYYVVTATNVNGESTNSAQAGAMPLPPASTAGCLLTYHNDNTRAGANTNEEVLSPANVNTSHFGKLWVLTLDGRVDAQPLVVAGVNIPGKGVRNVMFAATENDSVYAFDADSTNQFWRTSMLGANETPSDNRSCDQITPVIGVTATPVIDLQLGPNGTMFVVAMTKNSSDPNPYHHRIHALDLATGTNRVPAVEIAASYPGTGDHSSGGFVIFDPSQYKERCGLTLVNGVVYTAWSSHCDYPPYTGWIMGYDEQTLAQTTVLNVVPNGSEGAIWMSGAGLAVDAGNNLYFLDGNGTFDSTLTAGGFPISGDYGNSFMKLSTTSNQLAVADYFAIYTNAQESQADLDLGSGGVIVLPDMLDGQGHVRQLAVGAGKDQNIYLVDRSNMGKFNSSANANYQVLGNALIGGMWAMPAYFNGALYFGAVDNHLMAFPFQSAVLQPASSQTSQIFPYPGTTPGVSANGVSNAIVWATETNTSGVLHAFAASNLATEYYNTSQAGGGRDNFGTGIKFTTPTVINARVYVGTKTGVGVFGLLDTNTLTPLQAWRNSYFANPSNVGAGANDASPAGDGVMNIIKYALGLNPTNTATRSQLPSGAITRTGGQAYAELVVNRAVQQTDITYVVEVSSDLHTWASGPGSTVTLTNTATQLVVRDNSPLGGTPRYMRLRITVP